MKKILLFIFIFMLTISVVSCGNNKPISTTDTAQEKTTTQIDTNDSNTSEDQNTSTIETTDMKETTTKTTLTDEITTDTHTNTETTIDTTETEPEVKLSLNVDEQNSLESFNIEQKICFVSKFNIDNNPEIIFIFGNLTWIFEIEGKAYTIDTGKIYYEEFGNDYLMKWDLESAGFMPEVGKSYLIKVFAYGSNSAAPVYKGEVNITANLGKDENGNIIKQASFIPFEVSGGNNPFVYINVGDKDNVALSIIFNNQVYDLLKDKLNSNLVWTIKINEMEFTFEDYFINETANSLTIDFNIEGKGFIPYKGMIYNIGGSVSDNTGTILYNLMNRTLTANIVAAMIPDPERVGTLYDYKKVTPISGSTYLEHENFTKLFDGNIETKMYEPAEAREPVIFKTEGPIKIKSYSLVSANDNVAYGRLPSGWLLYGSNSGREDEWQVIDVQNDSPIKEINDFREYNFRVDIDNSYSYYKFEFSGGAIQFSEIQLFY